MEHVLEHVWNTPFTPPDLLEHMEHVPARCLPQKYLHLLLDPWGIPLEHPRPGLPSVIVSNIPPSWCSLTYRPLGVTPSPVPAGSAEGIGPCKV